MTLFQFVVLTTCCFVNRPAIGGNRPRDTVHRGNVNRSRVFCGYYPEVLFECISRSMVCKTYQNTEMTCSSVSRNIRSHIGAKLLLPCGNFFKCLNTFTVYVYHTHTPCTWSTDYFKENLSYRLLKQVTRPYIELISCPMQILIIWMLSPVYNIFTNNTEL